MDSFLNNINPAVYKQPSNLQEIKEKANGAKGLSDFDKADNVVQEFQGLLIGMMMKSMRSTVGKSELFHGGQAEEAFQGMLDQEFSNNAAKTDMLNLNDVLRKGMKLPFDDTFTWKEIEELDEEALSSIASALNGLDEKTMGKQLNKESDSAFVTKYLNNLSGVANLGRVDSASQKRHDLVNKFEGSQEEMNKRPNELKKAVLPESLLKQADPEKLEKALDDIDKYKAEVSYKDNLGGKLKQLNRKLLELVFPALTAKTNLVDQMNNRQAAKKAYAVE